MAYRQRETWEIVFYIYILIHQENNTNANKLSARKNTTVPLNYI